MKLKPRNVFFIARREIIANVMTKGFILAAVIPVIFLFLIGALAPMAEKVVQHVKEGREKPVKIGVVGGEPELLNAWIESAKDRRLANGLSKFDLQQLSTLGISEDVLIQNAKEKVRSGELDALMVLKGDVTANGGCDFYSMRGFEMGLPGEIASTLRNVVREIRLKAEGLDVDRINHLTRGITWNQFEITQEVKEGGEKRANFMRMFIPAMVCVMMMFFLIFASGQRLLQGILEEKTSRIVEVLLSSVSPTELFAGKVIGFYLIGLLQFALWTGFGLVFIQARGVTVSDYIPAGYFFHFLIYLTTGYLLYAALFTLIAAIVGDEKESQPFQMVFSLIVVLPMMFNVVLISQPNWWPVRLASFFPLFTPAIMAIRMTLVSVPWWEQMAIAVVSLLAAAVTIWMAARIFRVGVLMTGKRPSFREIGRWCFYRDSRGVIES